MQEDVSLQSFVANKGGKGEADYAAPVLLPATVGREQGRRRNPGGQDIPYRVTVAFVRPLAIDMRDRITLWDGITGPIVDLDKGTTDPVTGLPCATTCFLGFGG